MNALDMESPSQYSTSARAAAQLPAEVEGSRFSLPEGMAIALVAAGLSVAGVSGCRIRDVLVEIYKAHET